MCLCKCGLCALSALLTSIKLASPEGLEPTTFALTGRRSSIELWGRVFSRLRLSINQRCVWAIGKEQARKRIMLARSGLLSTTVFFLVQPREDRVPARDQYLKYLYCTIFLDLTMVSAALLGNDEYR